jgi:hypothetical protein
MASVVQEKQIRVGLVAQMWMSAMTSLLAEQEVQVAMELVAREGHGKREAQPRLAGRWGLVALMRQGGRGKREAHPRLAGWQRREVYRERAAIH